MKVCIEFLMIAGMLIGVSNIQAQTQSGFSLKASTDIKANQESNERAIEIREAEFKKDAIDPKVREKQAEKEREALRRKINTKNSTNQQSVKAQVRPAVITKHELNADEMAARDYRGGKKKKLAQRPSGTGIVSGTQIRKPRIIKSDSPSNADYSSMSVSVTTPRELLNHARAALEADKQAGILSEQAIRVKEANIRELESLVKKGNQ